MSEGYFDYLNSLPEEAKRFGKAMEVVTTTPPCSVTHFLNAYNFSSLSPDATFVDVGGSHGVVAIEVAKANARMHCVVQDIAEPVILAGKANLSKELEDRVEFVVHDFWTEQPLKGVDLFFFRWVLHDWSDLYAVKLLKNLIPALKKGSWVVINDICLPPKGVMTLYQERLLR